MPDSFCEDRYVYKADGVPQIWYYGNDKQSKIDVWIPSTHMPRAAARIFLKVTDVRIERIQDMKYDDYLREGTKVIRFATEEELRKNFTEIWNGTLKKEQLKMYRWDENPWVWVIESEKTDKI